MKIFILTHGLPNKEKETYVVAENMEVVARSYDLIKKIELVAEKAMVIKTPEDMKYED